MSEPRSAASSLRHDVRVCRCPGVTATVPWAIGRVFAHERNTKLYKIVLVRHGQSQWNLDNRFTGWYDVDLSEKGREEAAAGGQLLKEGGYEFDVVYTSVLKRAIRTMQIVMDEMDQMWVPVIRNWRLNEAPLWQSAGPEQGRNNPPARRGAGQNMASVLQHSPSPAHGRR